MMRNHAPRWIFDGWFFQSFWGLRCVTYFQTFFINTLSNSKEKMMYLFCSSTSNFLDKDDDESNDRDRKDRKDDHKSSKERSSKDKVSCFIYSFFLLLIQWCSVNMVVLMNVFVTSGEEADGHIQQRPADGICLLWPEPLWLFVGERLGGDLVHIGTAPFTCTGAHTRAHSGWGSILLSKLSPV